MVQLQQVHTIPLNELQTLANNKNIANNLRDIFPHPYTIDNAKEFIEIASSGRLGNVFGIFNDHIFIGVGSIIPQNYPERNGEIGYWLGEPFWGKGYGSTAVKLLTDYAFLELKLVRIYAGVYQNNLASMKVLEKAGYNLETIEPLSVNKNGLLLDKYIYALEIENYLKR